MIHKAWMIFQFKGKKKRQLRRLDYELSEKLKTCTFN